MHEIFLKVAGAILRDIVKLYEKKNQGIALLS